MLQTPALLFATDFQLGFGVVPPVWTLSVEVGFYVVLPLVAVALLPSPLRRARAGGRDRARLDGSGRSRDSVASLFGADLSSAAETGSTLLREPVPELDACVRHRDDGRLGCTCGCATGIPPQRLARWALVGHRADRRRALPSSSTWRVTGRSTTLNPFEGLFARQSLAWSRSATRSSSARRWWGPRLTPGVAQLPFAASRSRWIGRHQLRDLPDPLRRHLVRAQGVLAAPGWKRRRGARLVRARLSRLDRLRVPLRPVPRAPGETMGPPLRPPRAGAAGAEPGR